MPMLLPCPCSHAHVPGPMLLPCPCSCAHVAPMPMFPCPCCSHAHVPVPTLLPCPCSRAHVAPVPMFPCPCLSPVPMFPCPCLSHACVYPMSMFIPCSYIFHPHVHFISMSYVFTTSSCLTVCRLYPALVLKDQINFNITTEYLKPFFFNLFPQKLNHFIM